MSPGPEFFQTGMGNERSDLVLALKQVISKVTEGSLSGFDGNDTGDYYFYTIPEGE